MCGIAGIADFNQNPTTEELSKMLDKIPHRGPDSSGELIDFGIAMGMTRLSIIGIEDGDQPIFNEDKSIAVIRMEKFIII